MTTYVVKRKQNRGYIYPAPTGVLAATLTKYCSFEKPGKEFMPNPQWAIVRLYKTYNEYGVFPWGLWNRVRKILNLNEERNNEAWGLDIDEPELHADKKPQPRTRPYQIEAINALISNTGGIIQMPTGSGKTFTALEFLRITNLQALVVVHTKDLKNQWEAAIDLNESNARVVLYQSPLIKEYIKLYPVIIFDECHHVAARTLYETALRVPESTIMIGLSATPWRDDGLDMLIEAALGKIVYTIDRRQLIDAGVLSDATVYYVPLTPIRPDYLGYNEEYLKHVVMNKERNEKIVSIALELLHEHKRKVLILVNFIDHGNMIYSALKDKVRVKFVHGITKDRAVSFNDYDIIIASQIFNEGVDFPDLDALILASGGKSSIRVTQQVGRVLRKRIGKPKSIVIDFMDNTKYMKRHYLERRKQLANEFEVIEGWPPIAK